MQATAPAPTTRPTAHTGSPDIAHAYHKCDENLSLCGKDISNTRKVKLQQIRQRDVCIVCLDLSRVKYCPHCNAQQ